MIIDNSINNISKYYPNVIIDKYCIMPNHVHILLCIMGDDGEDVPSVSIVIGQMKRFVSKQIGFPIWQTSFHDHIIKNETAYARIWNYIDRNPQKRIDDLYRMIQTGEDDILPTRDVILTSSQKNDNIVM